MNRFRFILPLFACVVISSCSWTQRERELINAEGDTMRVLTIAEYEDSLLLRQNSAELSAEEILSPEYSILAGKMLATVTAPYVDGVGIAGPQVGILRRIVAVQRFDRNGAPFEVYPNVRVIAGRGEKVEGTEGCLSVPYINPYENTRFGKVPRFRDIDIRYTLPCGTRDTTEMVTGFTAVIFQHECDHLDGILFTDYLKK